MKNVHVCLNFKLIIQRYISILSFSASFIFCLTFCQFWLSY